MGEMGCRGWRVMGNGDGDGDGWEDFAARSSSFSSVAVPRREARGHVLGPFTAHGCLVWFGLVPCPSRRRFPLSIPSISILLVSSCPLVLLSYRHVLSHVAMANSKTSSQADTQASSFGLTPSMLRVHAYINHRL
ncbi:hypothetical protein BO71DRAFT_6537 [Aspergillus ellipticus CBS 707.79]|uniref:Uncharacterized protein n=1 Tax=Aspergillus ellipticus CBS 707.79 TaxID=1448320 RepID=A0A319D6V2_9EURO|nr:hypothetical protein BO71DRAFT_6537 [Aspergillus ellipticus CBS 707.79]